MGERVLFAFAVHCVFESDIRVVQHREYVVRRTGDLAHLSHDGFFLFAENVFLLAESVEDKEFIGLQFRILFDEAEKGALFDGEQLRREE